MPRQSNDPKAYQRRKAILTLLERAGREGLTVAAIWERLKTSRGWSATKRTIERDIEVLSTENQLLDSGTRPARFFLMDDYVPDFEVSLTDENLKILSMALANLRQTAPVYFSGLCDQFESDLMSSLPEQISEKLERFKSRHTTYSGLGGRSVVKNSEVMNTVLQALFHGRELLVAGYSSPYDTANKRHAQMCLGPIVLEMAGGHPYLVAETLSETPRGIKKYRLSRFSGLKLGESYTPNKKFLKDNMLESFWGFSARPQEVRDVRIRVNANLKAFFEETELHRSQKTKALADGSVEVSLRVPLAFPLVRLLQGLVQDIIEIDPPELREWIVKNLKSALGQIQAVGK